MLKKAYSDACLSRTNVFEWYGWFYNEWESVEDDLRAGRSHTSRTPENIVAVHSTLATDQQLMIGMLVEKLHVETVLQKI